MERVNRKRSEAKLQKKGGQPAAKPRKRAQPKPHRSNLNQTVELESYRRKRNFQKTPEPAGKIEAGSARPKFVVQEHHASHLHWDFRLEIGGVLKSWSIPKGPSVDPSKKRLAVQVEDHPLDYLTFTGAIPEGNYGAGKVFRWDIGTFKASEDPSGAWEKGSIKFELLGGRLRGKWHLFKMKGRQEGGKPLWLLQKSKDEFAGVDTEPTDQTPSPQKKRDIVFRVKPAEIKRSSSPAEAAVTQEEFLELKNPEGDLTVDIEGIPVTFTHLDRLYWPEEKITKFDLLAYYLRIASLMMPYLKGRPAILQRHPRGIGAPKFFQHDLESGPTYLHAVRIPNEQGREIDYAVYRDLPSLLYLVNIGTIEQHPWHSRLDRITQPDWLVLDLDPHGAPWENVMKTALTARKVFKRRHLKAYPKTSGSSGLHFYLPLRPEYEYEAVSAFAGELAKEIASAIPEIATVERTLAQRRPEQVYVDWLQNSRGKSMAAPYSVRAKKGATVSMPLTWEQLEKVVRISDFTMKNLFEKTILRKNPWSRFFDDRQEIK